MSLRLIYGRSGSGKTRFCLNEIKSKLTEDVNIPLVLLVPEQFTFQAERDLINILKTGGILKTEVLSFRRLAFRVFNDVGGITFPHIHSAGKCMIIYNILDKLHDSFKVFTKSAECKGFANTISKLITEMKRYNVTPLDLELAIRSLQPDNPLKDKLTELNAVYSEFETALSERYRDSDDDLTLASEKLIHTDIYDNAEIWIDGFSGFTPQEYMIIEQLLKKVKRINICFCTDELQRRPNSEGVDIFLPVKKAYSKLENIAKKNSIILDTPIHLNEKPVVRFRQSSELSHLERNFNEYPHKLYNGVTKDIELFASANIFTEIESTARDILKLCRDFDMRFRDILVVSRNLTSYEKLIEVIFTEYDIPCFIDTKTEVTNHPLVRLILSMLDIFIENWSYNAVFSYLKSGMTGIDRENIDIIENYVLACGIRGNMWTKDAVWNLNPEFFPSERDDDAKILMLEQIDAIRMDISKPLLDFRKKTKGRKTAAEICTAMFDFLCNLGVPERIETEINKFKKNGELTLANEYSQIWNIMMEVFDQTVEVMGDQTFGIERFSNILKVGLEEYKIGLIPASIDQVLVGSVERSKSHEIKALFILGANDGVFPSSTNEEGVLSDRERSLLSDVGVELASDTKTKSFDEQYLVYKALTTAEKYLKISWPIADPDGRALRPSIIVSRIKKIFPNVSESNNIIDVMPQHQEMELVSAKIPTFNSLICALRQKSDGLETDAMWKNVYHWYCKNDEWKQKCFNILSSFSYSNIATPLNNSTVKKLYGETLYSSVSKLEKYTSCPFAFFVQYGLGAKARKTFNLTPPDVGTFMHNVIERFSQQIAMEHHTVLSWRTLDREWCDLKVSEIVNDILRKMNGSGIASSKRYTTLTKRLKRVISRSVWLIAEHIKVGAFNPVDYEVDFSDRGKYPPITIEIDSGRTVKLTGRIDRVDSMPSENGTYLRIIDYKSGYKDFNLADVYYGLQLQLITYMDAIWTQNGENEYLPGGMLYFKIDDPIIRQNGKIDPEQIEDSIMKQFKMRGLLLADVKLIKSMDSTIQGPSVVIPATLNKGDLLGKNSSVASLEQFKLLRNYINRLLKNVCTELLDGNVEIRPYKRKTETSCKYCEFLSVCQFDTGMKDNSFKLLFEKADSEVWALMGDKDV